MKFYRYEAVQYAVIGDDGEYTDSHFPNPKLELRTYDLLRETPKGYWIGYGSLGYSRYNWKKWVSKTTKKRFAYPTEKEAIINFVKRTERRIEILDSQLIACRISLNLAKEKENEIQST
jgi:hypothetical protein